jgi:subtilisin-like proprotein convertase family protein/uncharacterized protein YvpB
MIMGLKRHGSINIFTSVAIVLLMIFLVSLPGLAGTSIESLPAPAHTNTPTIYSIKLLPESISTASPIPTTIGTQIIVITDTQTSTPTFTPSPTYTSTNTSTPTITATPYPTQFSYFPYLVRELFIPTYTPTPIPPPETVLFCDSLSHPISIPDNDASGINDDISITDGRVLVSVNLYLDISHSWVGDLVVKLTHQNTGETITTLDRPGSPPFGCGNDDIVAILDDGAAEPADNKCASYPHAISGIYLPGEALRVYFGISVSGTWRLNVSDRYQNDIGKLNHWCLETKLSDAMPAPSPTPTPVSLPSESYINGMSGQDQQFELDCESRSAVDWAKHFGFNIGEIDFLNHLPHSDDPEVGFVGDPDGTWGNIPPSDYGVHAPPVATQLRDYGLTANSFHSLKWDDLRAEIASGNPVIVWIIGGANYSLVNGTPHYYTAASTGDTTIVAPWEHTVILVGYTTNSVNVLNGSRLLSFPLTQFLDSWSVLDFMAVLARP